MLILSPRVTGVQDRGRTGGLAGRWHDCCVHGWQGKVSRALEPSRKE